MDSEEIKKRYTRIQQMWGDDHVVQFMVVPQYFTVFRTDEGLEHAEHFQGMLVKAIERMQMELAHDVVNELGVE